MTYEHEEPLVEAETFLIKGVRHSAEGCTFSQKGSLSLQNRDRMRIRTRELAFDPESCRSLVEVGAVPSDVPFAMDATNPDSQSESESGGASPGATDGVGTASHESFRVSIRQWFEEPAQQAVGDVTNYVEWSPTDNCASAGPWRRGHFRDWLEQTGWYLVGLTWDRGSNCFHVYSRNLDTHFKNEIFCGTIDTDVIFDINRVDGLAGETGRYTWQSKWHKFGGCNDFLSYHRDVDAFRL